jgi:hypothetical protein
MSATHRKIPENMGRLHQQAEYIRKESINAIESDEELLNHVALIEATMNHIDFFAKRTAVDLDQETIQLLGARIFNDLGSAYGQLTSGYYQIAAATLRDIMEIVYLWGLFDREPAKISEWRESDDKTRRDIFAPVKVRKFLDDFDNFKGGKRGEAYKLFCEYAAHATWHGFVLMRPTGGGQVIMGPFFDASLMKAVLVEMAQLAAQAGNYFSGFFEKTSGEPVALEVWLHRYVAAGEWAEKYLGRKHDRDFVADMQSWLLELRAKT